MHQAHITMFGIYPVIMTHNNCIASDSLELIKHMWILQIKNATYKSCPADGGYYLFLNYAWDGSILK